MNKNETINGDTLPVLPLRDMVVFPGMVVPVLVGRPRSVRAVEEAMRGDRRLLLLAQKAQGKEDPQPGELYDLGVEAEVLQSVRLPDNALRVLLEAKERRRVLSFSKASSWMESKSLSLALTEPAAPALEPATGALLRLFEEFVRLNPRMAPEAYQNASSVAEPGRLADLIAPHLSLKVPERQKLLETLDPAQRVAALSAALATENQLLNLQRQLQGKVRKRIEKGQREAFLHEQMKTIQQELGQRGEDLNEARELRQRIEKLAMPKEAKEKALKELTRMERSQPMSAESTVIRSYLDVLLSLPWGKHTKDRLDLKNAAKILEEDHAGLEKPKGRVLEHLAVRKLVDQLKGPILCFVGPPGVGKTSLARSIARAMGRKFERISLGGVRDEAEIRGHRRTYIGSMPGRLIQGLRRAGSFNPVILLDEIDKMSTDFRGDPASALLEVLDPEQNNAFSDHYLDLAIDLSQVLFITTANLLYEIPGPLRDRMEVIELPGYLDDEKIAIAQRFLLPKLLKAHGLKASQLDLDEGVLRQVIREYTREAGVRELERQMATLCRKAAKHVVDKGAKAVFKVTLENLSVSLGIPKFQKDETEREEQVGVANGLAWTGAGGEVLSIEVTLMPGKGALVLTGTLGDVMKESAQAALSWVRSHAASLGLSKDFYTRQDIHIHLPEGATPKDGPSAGIAMATALASALTGRAVKRDVAMTGEITLRGNVLPIGGLKEKSLAAHRSGIHTLIIPRKNRKDLDEIAETVRKDAKFHLVSSIEQVLELALEKKKATPKKGGRVEVPAALKWTGDATQAWA
ncbi:MAG: endopeptidase La [candidate division FCPU426 bacterium]